MLLAFTIFVRASVLYAIFFVIYGIFLFAIRPDPGIEAVSLLIVPAIGVWMVERNFAKRRRDRLVSSGAVAAAKEMQARQVDPPMRPVPALAPPSNVPVTSQSSHGSFSDKQPEISPRNLAALKAVEHAAAAAETSQPARNVHGWAGKRMSVTHAGRQLGGMIYVGSAPIIGRGYSSSKCKAFIDPSLKVATSGADRDGTSMNYWPSYTEILPICRAAYLDWLASGRNDATYNAGYMFLYFYGLERRFFIDQPGDEEKREILEEVIRLFGIYTGSGSAQRYLGQFIQVAQVALHDPRASEPTFSYRGFDLPLGLKMAIGAKLAQGETLSWDWALSWLICHPDHYLRTPATRCPEEFRALFRIVFEERFPQGLKVAKPRKALASSYEAASGEFSVKLQLDLDGAIIPDISGTRKPVEIAQEVAEEATEALEKFSRYIGRKPDGRGTIEAQALLPKALRNLFPSEDLLKLEAWARALLLEGGQILAVDLIERIEGAAPDKLSRGQLTGAADTLARVGVGLAPDPRNALRMPKIDEPLILFDLGDKVEKLEVVSPGYRQALLQLAMGAFVAQADGRVTGVERQALLTVASEAPNISEVERRELLANVDWLLLVPADLALLRRKLKDTGVETQASVRASLIAAAHADGAIQAEEVAGIEKIYKALGLDASLVYSDIHAGRATTGPVRVRAAEADAPGEMITPEAITPTRMLDASRIAAIRSDTARVNTVLGEIFSSDEGIDEASGAAESATLTGLDAASTALIRELIVAEKFSEQDYVAMCKRHGLLPDGALETINEWAFNTYDEALLDEYDGIEVSPEIAGAIKAEFDKENRNVQA